MAHADHTGYKGAETKGVLLGHRQSLLPFDLCNRQLECSGLSAEEIDVLQINEAVASVVLAFQRELGAPPKTPSSQWWRDSARSSARSQWRRRGDEGSQRWAEASSADVGVNVLRGRARKGNRPRTHVGFTDRPG